MTLFKTGTNTNRNVATHPAYHSFQTRQPSGSLQIPLLSSFLSEGGAKHAHLMPSHLMAWHAVPSHLPQHITSPPIRSIIIPSIWHPSRISCNLPPALSLSLVPLFSKTSVWWVCKGTEYAKPRWISHDTSAHPTRNPRCNKHPRVVRKDAPCSCFTL